ncbi:DUF3305 domain-containing protein [Psychromarinibacter halotolerans]|uniref:DUF3305 domain-containing protein n=1 Tax=Psychromarinibacter halotolerans TaxID=1775175 RepID=A0ABV7GPH4_9RHOB|nr:DUF3305 domain-containing protein [Psychromarinibacter halotolerans]MDF0594576.1 DUF3305 domain-containing protein [Psychromarinibacter halotolerans]
MKSSGRSQSLPVGVVLRRAPGVTRWAKWAWTVAGVLPGAGKADWRMLRSEGDVTEYHAFTGTVHLHATETEAYMVALNDTPPSLYVIMRREGTGDSPLSLVTVTASPYDAQDYADSGEEVVEKVPMPDGFAAWVEAFCDAHHVEHEFKKRRRDRSRVDLVEDGVGDARIVQTTDVYRSPRSARQGRLN